MIEWRDSSDRHGERHTVWLGPITIDLYRSGPRDPWWVDARGPSGVMRSQSWRLDAEHDTEAARARALAHALPIVNAIAEQIADVQREVAVAVANARLDAVV